jgi:hypothetical protein
MLAAGGEGLRRGADLVLRQPKVETLVEVPEVHVESAAAVRQETLVQNLAFNWRRSKTVSSHRETVRMKGMDKLHCSEAE